MRKVPGRDTGPAYSPERRTWYGYGSLSRQEKDGFGRFLHDATYIFGDISTMALPSFFYVMAADTADSSAMTAGALVAWMTMWVVGTTIRGGWIRPFATETLGWVSLRPSLLGLRLIAYNGVILVAAAGGVAVADVVPMRYASLLFAFLVASLFTLSFPRVAESVARWLDG